MSARKKPHARCPRCLLRAEACLCARIPSLAPATKVVIVAQKREAKRPTNTGRLAALALQDAVILTRGDQDAPLDLAPHLPPERAALLLYPADDAAELTPAFVARLGGPVTLVVPDGNWRQTAKMRRRDPVMAALPTVKLPAGEATRYRVRKESKGEGLATIEAVARALGALEGPEVRRVLEGLFDELVARTLAARGTIGEPA